MKRFKENPEKYIYWALFIIVLLAMVPIWYLGRYAVPSLDDYYFGQRPHNAWLETQSIKAVIKGACDMVKVYFYEKQATFSSIFLMSLFPGVLNEKWYFLTPLIMTGMIIGSTTALVHTLVAGCLGNRNKYLTGIINLLMIFLMIQTMLVPLEGIYWYNGALHYIFMESVLYFEISCILKFMYSEKKGTKTGLIALASLLGIIVGGGNLITGLQACILTGLFALFVICQYFGDKKENGFISKLNIKGFNRNNLYVLIPGIITIVSYLVNVLAPGNAKRQGIEIQMNPIKAIIESFYWGAVHGISWITPMMIITFVVIAVITWKLAGDFKGRFMHPVLMLIISFCVFSAMLTPTFFATSMDAPDRVKNIIYLAENMLIFINILNDMGYYRTVSRKEDNLFGKIFKQTDSHESEIIILGILLIMMIFVLPENKNEYTTLSAVRSVMNGEAARYYEQNWKRIELYNDTSKTDIVIHKLTDDAKPYLLFKEDISDKEGEDGYWQNVEISDYYKKSSITVIE